MSNSKHPAGLKVMFFTEMWERFGFYLILGILQLYLTDAESGGMAMDRRTAADIFGTFIALVYLTPFGWIDSR
jgi:POT family proton-dependent oligopeptide transporter